MPEKYAVFEVDLDETYRDLRRDWEGWVEGHGPGTERLLAPRRRTVRIVASRAEQLLEFVASMSMLDCVRRDVGEVRRLELDTVLISLPVG